MVRLAALAIGVLLSSATRAEGVLLPEGRFAPLFGLDKGQRSFAVAAFRLDRRLVTEAAFAAFLRSKPEWSSASVKPGMSPSTGNSAGSPRWIEISNTSPFARLPW